MPNAGFDFFETKSASFTFTNALPIPAGHFDKHSKAFVGTVQLVGYPIREFTDPGTKKTHKTGNADTVVHRKQDVKGGSGTTEIELVQLSLRGSIDVQVGNSTQRWDIIVGVSGSKPSKGSMTFTPKTFASKLTVWPVFQFERQSDGAKKHLDLGSMKIPDDKLEAVAQLNTLLASEVEWQEGPPVHEDALAIPELASIAVASHPVVHYAPTDSHIVLPAKGLPQ